MANAMEVATSGVGIGTGVGSTLLIRSQLDGTGETSILRPSVLWGIGTGLTAMATPMLLGRRRRGAAWEALEDYGASAFTAGVFSAFSPKGGGVGLPSV